MKRVVLDANIYISAILFGGNPEKVLDLARKRRIVVLISEAILAQIVRVLKKKFRWADWQISEIVKEIRTITIFVVPKQILKVIKGKNSDNRILECAIEGKAQYIISGDEHHLLPLKKFRGIKILNPAEFLKIT